MKENMTDSSPSSSWMAIFKDRLKELYDRIDTKIAIKVAITALLSFYLCMGIDKYFKHPIDLTTGLWCVLSAIVVLQYNIGATYKAIWTRFLGVVVGSITGALFVFWFGAQIESMGLAIFLTVVICSLLGIQDSYRIACLSVAIIIIPWKFHATGDPWVYAFYRFLDTCLGFVVAIGVSHFIWPSQALTSMRIQMADIFSLFRQFFENLISQGGVATNQKIMQSLEEEINDAFLSCKGVLEESKMELLLQFTPLGVWIELLNCQEKIWEYLHIVRQTFNQSLEEVIDEKLKTQLQQVLEGIDFALKALSSKLKLNKADFDFNSLNELQNALAQDLERFRSTHRTKTYHLQVVENYYVFFYQIKQILAELQNYHQLLDRLEVKKQDLATD